MTYIVFAILPKIEFKLADAAQVQQAGGACVTYIVFAIAGV